MTKKDYMKPTMNVVRIKTKAHLLINSGSSTSGLGTGQELNYDPNGGSQSNAWSRQNNVWDDNDGSDDE